VARSILDAVRDGDWDFEPDSYGELFFPSTGALPGSAEKLEVLCERVSRGWPLWHPADRRFAVDYQDEPRGLRRGLRDATD
jgi:hypothetical protein